MLLEIIGSKGVPGADAQRFSTQLLQVGRLSVNEQFVHRRNGNMIDQTKIDPHANLTQVVHGFFAADPFGSA